MKKKKIKKRDLGDKGEKVKWWEKLIYFLKRLDNGNKNWFSNWRSGAVK